MSITSDHHELAVVLRAFGPWGSRALAVTLGISPRRAGILASQMARRGWVVRHDRGWALTKRGDEMVDQWDADVIIARAEAKRGWL